MRLAVVVSILAIAVVGRPLIAAPVSGEAVYQKRCAVCHDSSNARVPPRDVLKKLSAARIVRTLDFGLMMNVASVMTHRRRRNAFRQLRLFEIRRHPRERPARVRAGVDRCYRSTLATWRSDQR